MIFSRRRHSTETGFTLLEVLISVTLVALISVGIWALLRISIHSWTRATGYIDVNQRHRSIMGSVQKQISSAYPLNCSQTYAQQAGVKRYPLFIGDENNLLFLSLNSLQFTANPGLTYISYELAQSPSGSGYALIERETPYSGQGPDDSVLTQALGESRATVVFDNLTEFTFQYFSVGDTNNSPQWVSQWDGQSLMKIPAAVQLTMVFNDRGNSVEQNIVAPIIADATNSQTGQ